MFNLSKIYIVGNVASGKTTLSKKLSKKLNIPCYELDSIVWEDTHEGHYKRTPEQQATIINEINNTRDWIIEGTYRKSCYQLFNMADKIIFLDPPIWIRKYRIFIRFIKQQFNIEKCNYKSDIKMLKLMYKWTNDFEDNRSQFEKMLNKYSEKLVTIKQY